ncbi:hypothetical protein BVY03_02815 [bacterium K02(2017)]|nr:hypothetical protein BVY03_02815 [bacterium K02(2017)]
MLNFRRRKITLVGMLFSIVLIGVLSHMAWKQLLGQEGKFYAEHFIKGLINKVDQIEVLLTEDLTPDFRQQLFGKPLAELNLENEPIINNLRIKIKQLIGIDHAFIGFYTNCNKTHPQTCYIDFDSTGRDVSNYQPHSRPWYLATQSHTDWVLLNFMRLRATRRAGYPPQWGWVLSKKIYQDKTQKSGLWFNIFIPINSNIRSENNFNEFHKSIFNLAIENKSHVFDYFELNIRNIRLYDELIMSKNNLNENKLICHENNEYEFFNSYYRAYISCRYDREVWHINYSKIYDSKIHGGLIIIAGLFLLFLAFRFFSYIQLMQNRSVQDRLEIEKAKTAHLIGSKLIHDLKKGVMGPLNQLSLNYLHDFDTEILQPDFKTRLKSLLFHHFKYLELLNKYIQLLTNNLKRLREKSWVKFDQNIIIKYLDWILGSYQLESIDKAEDNIILRLKMQVKSSDVLVRLYTSESSFYIPEMSFYRIFKNLWENFNAYGQGDFNLDLIKEKNKIILVASNKVKEESEHTASSTNLGILIIKQLLEDNFGKDKVESHVECVNQTYRVELKFPLAVRPIK